MSRKKVLIAEGGKLNGGLMTHMREVAFGNAACVELHRAGVRSDTMRNDQAMMDAAEAKRAAKKAKNAKRAGK